MIELKNISKRFGPVEAVSDLSFVVSTGDVLGFLGPNGAGKSTTLKIIAGYLNPDSGSVWVDGLDVSQKRPQAQSAIGYLPEGAPAYLDMEVGSFLAFIADIRNIRGARRSMALERVIELLHLEKVQKQLIGSLSKGFRRRLGLAAAIIHEPSCLILDEPTDGLDPNQKYEVRKLIRSLARDHTILMSTHLLEEVDAICSRVVVIAGGKLRADSTAADLAKTSRYHGAVSFKTSDSVKAIGALEGVAGASGFSVEPSEQRVYVFPSAPEGLLEHIAARLHNRNIGFSEIRTERGRLDQVFRALTNGGSL